MCQFLLLPHFVGIPVFNAIIVDPDQTPRSAAFDLGLQCLRISLFGPVGLNGCSCGVPLTNLDIYCSDVPRRHIFSRHGLNIRCRICLREVNVLDLGKRLETGISLFTSLLGSLFAWQSTIRNFTKSYIPWIKYLLTIYTKWIILS